MDVATAVATGAQGEVSPLLSGAVSLILPIILILLVYFIPAIIAIRKKHVQKTAIIVLNILLGWTFLGWVGALVWALMKENKS